jgi:hypothetical protein
MFDSLREVFLSLIFGTSAIVTPTHVDLAPNKIIVLRAPKAMKPAFDSMKVSIELGTVNNEKKSAVLNGQLVKDVGDVDVKICDDTQQCFDLGAPGAYFSANGYGISFLLTDDKLKGRTITEVRIKTAQLLPNVIVTWQNYTQ